MTNSTSAYGALFRIPLDDERSVADPIHAALAKWNASGQPLMDRAPNSGHDDGNWYAEFVFLAKFEGKVEVAQGTPVPDSENSAILYPCTPSDAVRVAVKQFVKTTEIEPVAIGWISVEDNMS